MKIWEAIIYGIVGGLTELLPISFSGHAAVLRSALNLSSLTEGSGLYVRAAICLGIIVAIILAFRTESRTAGKEALAMTGLRRCSRRDRNRPLRRSLLMGAIALLPMLISLTFTAAAERITRMLFVALFFAVNGTVIYFCSRGMHGTKNERTLTLPDTILIGLSRMLAVFPGMSSVGVSLSVGNVCGLSREYNFRFCYLLTLAYSVVSFFYRLIRAFAFGSFSASVLLLMLTAAIMSSVFGYLAIQYLKYLVHKNKFNVFAYYCWDAVAIVLIVALVNA